MHTQLLYVQVASPRDPLLRDLVPQSRHETQARLSGGEDPPHPHAALYLLIEPLKCVVVLMRRR